MPNKDSYSAKLAARLKAGRTTSRSGRSAGRKSRTQEDVVEAVALPHDVHPDRYPKHEDPAKGQTYHGECNRTACESRRAVFWNRGTRGLYCPTCARGINGRDPVPLCVVVDKKPTLEEMEVMYREMMDAMSEHRRGTVAA
jgi:hypothetical protein